MVSRYTLNALIRATKKYLIGSATYGKIWQHQTPAFYNDIYDDCINQHDDFKEYAEKKTFDTALEVGCGVGIYTIRTKLFNGKKYTGIDISKPAIKECKNINDVHEFICDDFQKMDLNRKFDLVFTHAVIDHVYDIDDFTKRILDATSKYAYISAYRGFQPGLTNHKMTYNRHNGCYFSDVSIIQLRKVLLESGIKENQITTRTVGKHGILEIDKTL